VVVGWSSDVTDIYFTAVGDDLFGNLCVCGDRSPSPQKFTIIDLFMAPGSAKFTDFAIEIHQVGTAQKIDRTDAHPAINLVSDELFDDARLVGIPALTSNNFTLI
jgi:hypothetical protein